MNSHIYQYLLWTTQTQIFKKIDRILKNDFKTHYFDNFGNNHLTLISTHVYEAKFIKYK